MRGPGYFYSLHRLRLVRRVWMLVWVMLFSSTVIAAGQGWVHQQNFHMACHAGSESSGSQNHLEHCQLCLVHWVGLETPVQMVQGQSVVGWSSPLHSPISSAFRWYALHNLTTGPPIFA